MVLRGLLVLVATATLAACAGGTSEDRVIELIGEHAVAGPQGIQGPAGGTHSSDGGRRRV